MSSTRAGTLLALLLLAGCREASAPFNARASLTSCNSMADCTQPAPGGCFTVQCTGHVCTPTGGACAGGCGVDDTLCDDANPCTTDACVVGACVNLPAPGAGCCVTVIDCAASNACQTASCAQGSCTYVSNGGAGCCNVSADCSGTASCNANTCTCGGGKYCPGVGCVATGGCCSAADCDSSHSTGASCTGGVCSYTGCSGGFGDCDTTGANLAGCETNVTSGDSSNCGACGQVCTPTNASAASCSGGKCSYLCTGTFGDCNQSGFNGNGCETNLATSSSNCGACGQACSATNNSARSCSAGTCSYTCNAGFADCDSAVGSNTDGCEVNLNTSAVNCGACGRACSASGVSGAPTCAGGLCTSSCTAGLGNCVRPAAPGADDGCETDLTQSASNCGGCGRVCSSANTAAVTCGGGLCTSSCMAGFGNCSRPAFPTADNGCEANVTNDVNHCGGCAIVCAAPTNSCQVTTCASQACGYVSTGAVGCCNTVAQCTPNVCQTASCTANRCVYAAKVGVAGCCSAVGDCPIQTDPCKTNTCVANVCGAMAIACGDMGAPDMTTVFDLSRPPDLEAADLSAAPDLSVPADLAVPVDAAPPDFSGLSLTGGGGCAYGGEGAGAGAGALLLVVLLLVLRRRHA